MVRWHNGRQQTCLSSAGSLIGGYRRTKLDRYSNSKGFNRIAVSGGIVVLGLKLKMCLTLNVGFACYATDIEAKFLFTLQHIYDDGLDGLIHRVGTGIS
ncbi:hypothetical protein CDAR_614221 [Caerostris darwini]|uniref:Uncharacterized protein n=1 Tax=Caerostris darwini TaxID=1538125 RepID=A0AAV4WAT6_9ARAC|nr:hypothetical protein CDAR_614221 [Caerostris darwini]